MSNHVKIRDRKRGGARSERVSRFRKKRPKTFKTAEAAEAYAKKKGLKDYSVINIREHFGGTKFKIVTSD